MWLMLGRSQTEYANEIVLTFALIVVTMQVEEIDMANTLQVRIDDDLKTQATMVYDQLGIDLSTAVRMFLKKSVAVNGIPFEVKNEYRRDRAVAALNECRTLSEENGNSNMSLEDINAEIAAYRKEERDRK